MRVKVKCVVRYVVPAAHTALKLIILRDDSEIGMTKLNPTPLRCASPQIANIPYTAGTDLEKISRASNGTRWIRGDLWAAPL